MKKGESPISKVSSHKAIGEYWDTHDLSEIWDKTRKIRLSISKSNPRRITTLLRKAYPRKFG